MAELILIYVLVLSGPPGACGADGVRAGAAAAETAAAAAGSVQDP
jgi:hypothetical protein